jgi:predicted Na+-dependent transporter
MGNINLALAIMQVTALTAAAAIPLLVYLAIRQERRADARWKLSRFMRRMRLLRRASLTRYDHAHHDTDWAA